MSQNFLRKGVISPTNSSGTVLNYKFSVSSVPQIIDISAIGLYGIPFTIEISPDVVNDPLVSVRVDVSFDYETTYQSVETFTSYSARRWVRSPEEKNPTHLMVYTVSGTSESSEFIIGA